MEKLSLDLERGRNIYPKENQDKKKILYLI